MKPYLVTSAPAAERQLAKLDRHIGKRIAEAIAKLSQNPRPPGCKNFLVWMPGASVWVIIASSIKLPMKGFLCSLSGSAIAGMFMIDLKTQ